MVVVQDEEPGQVTWSIALVIWLADVVARSVRELPWESLSNFIRRKDDVKTAVEMLLGGEED